uniref:Granulin precursor n=1 Tax=Anas platyrhynchos TaxID=8839 RepID=A0A8B9T995_ANAPL
MRTTVTLRLALALALAGVAAVSALRCPDGTSECPSNATCCVTPDGSWGCCPMPQVWSRARGGHRPAAATVVTGPCAAATGSTAVPKAPPATWSAPCAPRCRTRRGRRHAVRLGWDWDPPGAILGAQGTLAVTIRLSPVGDVKCDDQMSCPDGNTCCRLSSGAWGCCPLEEVGGTGGTRTGPQGRDGQDASPRDVPREPCPLPGVPHAPGGLGAGVPVPWVGESVGVPCPPVSPVPHLPPMSPQAVCCPDHVHCCPQGYTCDPQGGTCLQGGVRLPWLSKTPARGRAGDVKCDDETSCPDGNTCCRLSSGAWGCCPLEQVGGTGSGPCAPSLGTMGMGCGSLGGGRLHALSSPPSSTPHPGCDTHARWRGHHVGCPVSCPPPAPSAPWLLEMCQFGGGGGFPYTCPPSPPPITTSAVWAVWHWAGGGHGVLGGGAGCHQAVVCPSVPPPKAVCCKDHQHCCPRGYTCNAATQSCEKLLAATPLRFPVPTGPPLSPPRPVATIPADTARACPPGQRCCRSKDGSWARCPFAQGSCCEDGRRCCPAGYRCARGGRECWPQRWDVGGGISSRTLL